MRLLPLLLLLSLPLPMAVSAHPIERVDPPSWWVGFENTTVELLVHGDKVGTLTPAVDYPGVAISDFHALENPNYLSVTLVINPGTRAGTVPLTFSRGKATVAQLDYVLAERRPDSRTRRGFDAHDTVYLIMPDRFANGSVSNDAPAGTRDRADRKDPNARHGGDLQGIIDHLDFIRNMGYTQLWLTPVMENDMPGYSYHGYSITDHYKTDPRFGSNEDYRRLADAARARGIGLIQDVVPNHIGLSHWWMKDLPAADWISGHGEVALTTHAHKTQIDIHAAPSDRQKFIDGWFDTSMPDLHPMSSSLGNYLLQNAIWWIEYAGLSGLRIDTYPYTDKRYTREYCQRILREYPSLNIVGEEAPGNADPVIISYWQAGRTNRDGYESTLPTLMDFPLRDAMLGALAHPGNTYQGTRQIYEVLADDVIYADPMRLLVLADNHDTDRLFKLVNRDDAVFRMAMTLVATVRGIPQVTYGTEFEWSNDEPGDGAKRLDFPGGFQGDAANAFTGAGLTAQQASTLGFMRRLFTWRSTSLPVQTGSFVHYVPEEDVYVYFRISGQDKVMVILNNNTGEKTLDLRRFRETLGSANHAKDVLAERSIDLAKSLTLAPRSALVLDELK